MIDWTINLANILTFGTLVGGLLLHAGSVRSSNQRMSSDLFDLKVEIKKLGEILINQAVQNTRLDAQDLRQNKQDARLDRIEQDIKEMRHGEGFILPLEAAMRAKKPGPGVG